MSGFTPFMNWRQGWRDLLVAWRLLGDSRVPPATKLVPLAAVLYVLWPLDIIADTWPMIGQLDDIGVLLIGVQYFLKLAPVAVVAAYRDRS